MAVEFKATVQKCEKPYGRRITNEQCFCKPAAANWPRAKICFAKCFEAELAKCLACVADAPIVLEFPVALSFAAHQIARPSHANSGRNVVAKPLQTMPAWFGLCGSAPQGPGLG